jgi:hypothetical protein
MPAPLPLDWPAKESRRPAQESPHLGEQHVDRARLCKKPIRRRGIHPTRIVVRAAGDDRDVTCARVCAQLSYRLPAVHDGHREVGDDDVRDEIAGLLETVSPVPGLGDDVPFQLEDHGVQLARVRRVVDNESQAPRADMRTLPCTTPPATPVQG